MTIAMDPRLIDALLQWQAELGADEYMDDGPIDRFAVAEREAERRVLEAASKPVPGRPAPLAPPPEAPKVDVVAEARSLAASATSLESLAEIQASYPHLDLRRGARNFVFSDGRAGARLMVIGEAPGADEDRQGRPFVGKAGQLLDRMLAAIGIRRDDPDLDQAAYITNVLPWRPPGNRDAQQEELDMMLPFLTRHIELAAPDMLLLIGNTSCQALLGQRGITRLRGTWTEALGLPVLPLLHPSYLLLNPHAKRETWADLLSLKARLRKP